MLDWTFASNPKTVEFFELRLEAPFEVFKWSPVSDEDMYWAVVKKLLVVISIIEVSKLDRLKDTPG